MSEMQPLQKTPVPDMEKDLEILAYDGSKGNLAQAVLSSYINDDVSF